MLVEAARTVLIQGTINDCTLCNTFGHPEVYIGRQLCAPFCFEEFSITSLLVGCLNKVESLPIWLGYMVPPATVFSFTVRSTSYLNSP